MLVLAISPAASGSSGSNTIYNAFVKPKPGNLPSEAFEAQSASQFGDEVTFAGTNRKLKAVRLQLSSWGCETGHWFSGNCHTSHAATFAQPITFNIYQPPSSGYGVGALIASKTQTFNVRYRPSASKKCTGSGAYCDGGTAGVSTFRLDLPSSACWGALVPAVQFTASRHQRSDTGAGASARPQA